MLTNTVHVDYHFCYVGRLHRLKSYVPPQLLTVTTIKSTQEIATPLPILTAIKAKCVGKNSLH